MRIHQSPSNNYKNPINIPLNHPTLPCITGPWPVAPKSCQSFKPSDSCWSARRPFCCRTWISCGERGHGGHVPIWKPSWTFIEGFFWQFFWPCNPNFSIYWYWFRLELVKIEWIWLELVHHVGFQVGRYYIQLLSTNSKQNTCGQLWGTSFLSPTCPQLLCELLGSAMNCNSDLCCNMGLSSRASVSLSSCQYSFRTSSSPLQHREEMDLLCLVQMCQAFSTATLALEKALSRGWHGNSPDHLTPERTQLLSWQICAYGLFFPTLLQPGGWTWPWPGVHQPSLSRASSPAIIGVT